ncbi:MAG: transposase [Gemmatimonadota bacterium]
MIRTKQDHVQAVDTERSEHRIYAHIAWSTLGSLHIPGPRRQAIIERHLIVLCRRLDAEPIAVVAAADRVHVLLRYKPTHSLTSLVVRLKSGSRVALRTAGHGVEWASGFAAVSVGSLDVRRVMRRLASMSLQADT